MADIELPQLGESVTEGTITRWFKEIGDQVAEDEPLFEVSTDKVDSEVPSPTSGYLAEILVPEGDTVDVGTKIAVLSDSPPGEAGGGGEEAAPAETAAPEAADGPDAAEGQPGGEEAGEPAPAATQAQPDPEASTAPPDAGDAGADDGAQGPPPGDTASPADGDEPAPPGDQAAEEAIAEEPAPAAETEVSGRAEAPTTTSAEATQEPSPSAQEAQPATPSEPDRDAPLLSPVVRRLLDEAGVDASEVTGTGIGDRVTRSDVEQHLRSRDGAEAAVSPAGETPAAPPTQPAPPTPATTPAPAPDELGAPDAVAPAATPAPEPRRPAPATARVAAASAAAVGADDEVPLNKIRTITATHMVRSLETSAHAYVSTEVDFEAVDRVRTAAKEQFKADEGISLTFLPFVSRALVDALAEYPQVNASMGDDPSKLVVHGSINLGIAVDLEHEGLIVPVVHDAQDQRLRAIARNVADLADRAKAKKLTADDITGGTVTITNVGSTGNAFLLPIINQPQVMILATDGVTRKPVVVAAPDGSESIAIHSVGNLTLGWDHRAFDGAYAAQFLARIKDILQTRDWTAEL